MSVRVMVTGLLGLSICLADPLQAQTTDPAQAARHRNQCRLAAQVLDIGRPEPKYDWAISYIQTCPETGVPAIAAHWDRVRADTSDVIRLRHTSRRIRDRRIFEKMHSVVQDRTRVSVVRVGAMMVMADYIRPQADFYFRLVQPPADSSRYFRGTPGGVIHWQQTPGPEPVSEMMIGEGLSLLTRIGEDRAGEPLEVWYAAAMMMQYFDRLAARVQ